MVNNMILYNDIYYYHIYIYVLCTNIHTIINAPLPQYCTISIIYIYYNFYYDNDNE